MANDSSSLSALPPALLIAHGRVSLVTPEGELLSLSLAEAQKHLQGLPPPVVIHAPRTQARLNFLNAAKPWLDLLELYAFVHPAQPLVPTVRGLAIALDISEEKIRKAEAGILFEFMYVLLDALKHKMTAAAHALLLRLYQAQWGWAPLIMRYLGISDDQGTKTSPAEALQVWRYLPKWEDAPPRPPASSHGVSPTEARSELSRILGPEAETRVGQADFAGVASYAFAPRSEAQIPHIVLAEAGTGTGKTLGYIAPAQLWSKRNNGCVWISTYTRHLQNQIDTELTRLYPAAQERRKHVVIRKGRENYLCLLNLEEIINSSRSNAHPRHAIMLCLIARWAMSTHDGDIMGGDLPSWFGELFMPSSLVELADRRGECIHGACPHYQKCFIEHSIRQARDADIVIANHALVMHQAAWSGAEENYYNKDENAPTRYIFDEGHHIASAADTAFRSVLSGRECAELRRWILGAEGGRSRSKGLKRRLDDLVVGHADMEQALHEALLAARYLPESGWMNRLCGLALDPQAAPPKNATEQFLFYLQKQLAARTVGSQSPQHSHNTQECDLLPINTDLIPPAQRLHQAFSALVQALSRLKKGFAKMLGNPKEELDPTTRGRFEAMCRTIERRAINCLDGWLAMLSDILTPAPYMPDASPVHVTFIRQDSDPNAKKWATYDISLNRHWLDPTAPFALTLAGSAHGVLITSATLRDEERYDNAEESWQEAEKRVGASHFPAPALRAALKSPFDYPGQARAFIVNDVQNTSLNTLSAAYKTLFMASGGGALGLFTAISRLKAVYQQIMPALEEADIPLLAQHIDELNNATLIDIFKTEENSCLLGTDAMRDGVDIPGRALRLVVFERVPWPRPDILHRERRRFLTPTTPSYYDDQIARLKLRQAFGRLIRRKTDKGAFVILDKRTPSRILSALPRGITVRRCPLKETAHEIQEFLNS